MYLLEIVEGFNSQQRSKGWVLNIAYFLKNYTLSDDNVVISEVDALMCIVLSKAEKHVPYEELAGTTECITLQPRYRTNRDRYNRV